MLNNDNSIDGILVQLPLPSQLDSKKVIERISPYKDVDGFHPYNLGKILEGDPLFIPCTPLGIIELLKRYNVKTTGKKAVVVGGGGTHRLGLYDSVLVKENHLSKVEIFDVVRSIAFNKKKINFAEIEVENLSQLNLVIKEIEKYKERKVKWVIMLDNFSLPNTKKAILILKKKNIYCEISGNIDERNIIKYCNLHPDIISSGALTHSVKALDFSLKIIG